MHCGGQIFWEGAFLGGQTTTPYLVSLSSLFPSIFLTTIVFRSACVQTVAYTHFPL